MDGGKVGRELTFLSRASEDGRGGGKGRKEGSWNLCFRKIIPNFWAKGSEGRRRAPKSVELPKTRVRSFEHHY